MKNIRVFLSENFQFLEVKFSIYLNRHVFVMESQSHHLALPKHGDHSARQDPVNIAMTTYITIL